MAKKKKEIVVNHGFIAELISKDGVYNWLISKGLEQISNGETLGRNMEHFLTVVGAISYK